jgi:DNA replication and repair protein RecF
VLTPNHHTLFVGSPKERRHWLDWSLFHVKQHYLDAWKGYHRALRHRNTLLKEACFHNSIEIEGWEKRIDQEATKIDSMRTCYLNDLNEALNKKHLPVVLSGDANISYSNNNYAEQGLGAVLAKNRRGDANKGYTSVGPHRTDIVFNYRGIRAEKHLSRGQIKLFAAALISAQLEKLKEKGGNPIMLVDDLCAELDQNASEKMLSLLLANNIQTFVSSIVVPDRLKKGKNNVATFHVEHGNIKKMLE